MKTRKLNLLFLSAFFILSCSKSEPADKVNNTSLTGEWTFVSHAQRDGKQLDENNKVLATFFSYSIDEVGKYNFMENDTVVYNFGYTSKILTTPNGAPQPTVQTVTVANKSFTRGYSHDKANNTLSIQEGSALVKYTIEKLDADTLRFDLG